MNRFEIEMAMYGSLENLKNQRLILSCNDFRDVTAIKRLSEIEPILFMGNHKWTRLKKLMRFTYTLAFWI